MLAVDWATKHNNNSRKIAKTTLNKQFILIQEYIPGLQVQQLTGKRCQNFFGDDANNLINIGKLIILDIALNNADRFPITHVWHSATGNAQNFICMIDQDRKEWENVE